MLLLFDLFCAEWCMCTVLHQGTESSSVNIFLKNHIYSFLKNEGLHVCQDPNFKPSHNVNTQAWYCIQHQVKLWMSVSLSTYRCLSVSVGEDAMDLHFFFVHMVDIYPQFLTHGIWWPVCFWCVVVVICVLLQEKKRKEKYSILYIKCSRAHFNTFDPFDWMATLLWHHKQQ